jgi:hypothetical protein
MIVVSSNEKGVRTSICLGNQEKNEAFFSKFLHVDLLFFLVFEE